MIRHMTVVAVLSLLTGFVPARVGAQEMASGGLPAASSLQETYYFALGAATSGGGAPQGWSSSFPETMEYGSPQLRDIHQRLQRLEAQNADLAFQNQQLRSLLAIGTAGERLPQTTWGSDVMLAGAADSPVSPAPGQAAEIAAGMLELKTGMEKLGAGVQQLGENLTVTTAYKDYGFKLALFGALSGEMIFADARPLIPTAVTVISPDFGRDTQIAEISAKSSYLGAAAVGPRIGCYQSGGLILAYFYSSSILDDNYGFFIARAYGELKNEHWRYSIGVDGDVINPLAPEMINWAAGGGAGNLGFLRAQFRVERYFHPSDACQVTAQFALTDPIPTNYENFTLKEGLTESNGWPNIEGRLALGVGPLVRRAGVCVRAHEVGVSGLVGQLRRTGDVLTPNAVADVWAVGADARAAVTDRLGVKCEVYHGQTVGTYLGAIVQNFNADRQGIRSTGGWSEIYCYWTPCLHSHFGYGIDDPLDSDLTVAQSRRNQFYFANILWDVTQSLDLGFDVSHWDTDYMPPLRDNSAMVYNTRVRIKF